VAPEEVPVSRAYSTALLPPLLLCDQEITDIPTTVPITEIVARHGPRVPGPNAAQRDFRIGFVGESRDRFFTETEMTFYDVLAEWFTMPVPPDAPDPYLTQNWVSIRRFFGEDTSWQSRVDSVLTPHITGITNKIQGAVTITATGFPRLAYEVLASGDLVSWETTALLNSSDTGLIEHSEPLTTSPGRRFFKLRGAGSQP
jgi:hypothetical protein